MAGYSVPLFSVIIPAFNAAATLGAAIDSVLAQTCIEYEIIVVDDGSTDATPEVIAGYGDKVRVVRQENRGLSAARNSGARAAWGAWLALLDADDSWRPDKLATVADRIGEDPHPVMWFSDASCVRPGEPAAFKLYMPTEIAKAPSFDEMMAGRFQILPSSAVIRADAYRRAGGFSEEFKGASGFEDVFFWLCLREQGAFGYVPAPLVVYTVTPLANALARYKPGFAVFKRLVRARYGVAGEPLIATRRRARVNRWAHLGRVALESGHFRAARSAFFNALSEDPRRIKNILRWMKTFVPRALLPARRARRENASPEQPDDAAFFARPAENSLASARIIAPMLIDLIEPRSIVDVGCGAGSWLKAFAENEIGELRGYDGDYVDRRCLLIDAERFTPIDLSQAFSIDGHYDLAICLEIAEHIPPRNAPHLIEELVRAAPIILFSAAVPGQKDPGHVNEQWPAYWRSLFALHDYVLLDPLRPRLRDDRRVKWCYRQNILVFAKAGTIAGNPRLRAWAEQPIVELPWLHASIVNGPQASAASAAPEWIATDPELKKKLDARR